MTVVLVITREQTMAELCRQKLTSSGHTVTICPDAAAAMRSMVALSVDILCVDSAALSREMEDLWRWLQSDNERARLPVLYLLPPGMRWVKPHYYRPGFDTCLVKPLNESDLLDRLSTALQAATRSARPQGRRLLRSPSGTFIADPERYELWADGKKVALTATEFRLFAYLMERADTPVPVNELLENVWGFLPGTGGPEIVRAHVCNIRRKMKSLGEKASLLQTLAHRGYRLSSGPISQP